MIPISNTTKRAYRILLIIICLLSVIALSGLLTYRQIATTGMLKHWRFKIELYLDGTVHKPWAYRVLVPLSIRFLTRVLPEDQLEDAIRLGDTSIQTLQSYSLGNLSADEGRADGKGLPKTAPSYYYHLALVLFLPLLVYAVIIGLLYRELFVSSWSYHALIPFLSLLILIPFVSGGFGHIYDFPVLMFMAALLYAMATHRHKLVLVLFAVSCLNKETTLLMAVAYAAYFYDRLPMRKFWLYLGIQCAAFVLIHGYVRYHFADNPGTGMEFWWLHQVAWLTRRSFGDFATFLAIVALIAFRWHEKPLFIRRTSAMLIPHIGLFLVAVNPGEMRNLYESLPLISLFVCRNLELLGRSLLGSHPANLRAHEKRQATVSS